MLRQRSKTTEPYESQYSEKPMKSHLEAENQVSETNDISSIGGNEQEQFQNNEISREMRMQDSLSIVENNSHLSNITNLTHLFKAKHQKEQAKYKNNLAYVLASRMPNNVRNQVIEIVKYYEQHMECQIKHIHKLVQENKRLKHQIQSQQDKQNCRDQANSVNTIKSQKYELDSQRITQLQNCILQKNKNISSLNKQITELIAKNKKYKKRVYQLQSKSPIKSELAQFI